MPEITDALVVHLEDKRGGAGELILFIVPAEGTAGEHDELHQRIKQALRAELSPRHVPDTIVSVPAIPRTLTAKKLEAPIKRILLGARPEDVASRDALAQPEALDAFVEYARTRAQAPAQSPAG
jgi:acetoacetyl-CoA synthetase